MTQAWPRGGFCEGAPRSAPDSHDEPAHDIIPVARPWCGCSPPTWCNPFGGIDYPMSSDRGIRAGMKVPCFQARCDSPPFRWTSLTTGVQTGQRCQSEGSHAPCSSAQRIERTAMENELRGGDRFQSLGCRQVFGLAQGGKGSTLVTPVVHEVGVSQPGGAAAGFQYLMFHKSRVASVAKRRGRSSPYLDPCLSTLRARGCPFLVSHITVLR